MGSEMCIRDSKITTLALKQLEKPKSKSPLPRPLARATPEPRPAKQPQPRLQHTDSSGRSACFHGKEESTRLATSSPVFSRYTGRKPFPVGTLLPPTRAQLLKVSTGSAGSFSSSRTVPHVRSAPSATVEQDKAGTSRRDSGDSTASGQINRTVIPLHVKESQLSSSRTGSELPFPVGLRQISSGAQQEYFWPFFSYE